MLKVPTDKWLHFFVSLLLAIAISSLLANVFYTVAPNDPGTRTACAYGASLFFTLAIGVAKELRDRKQPGNHFCWKDIQADALGALAGSPFAFVAYLL